MVREIKAQNFFFRRRVTTPSTKAALLGHDSTSSLCDDSDSFEREERRLADLAFFFGLFHACSINPD